MLHKQFFDETSTKTRYNSRPPDLVMPVVIAFLLISRLFIMECGVLHKLEDVVRSLVNKSLLWCFGL